MENQRFINKFTLAVVTVTDRKEIVGPRRTTRLVYYTKDAATPPEKTKKGDSTGWGPVEVVKPEYVFDRCYIRI